MATVTGGGEMVWAIEVTWKRRKGSPVEARGMSEQTERELERSLAYEQASGMIESSCQRVEGRTADWCDLDAVDEPVGDVEAEARYLEGRGLLERHSDNPRWVSIRDESEGLPEPVDRVRELALHFADRLAADVLDGAGEGPVWLTDDPALQDDPEAHGAWFRDGKRGRTEAAEFARALEYMTARGLLETRAEFPGCYRVRELGPEPEVRG